MIQTIKQMFHSCSELPGSCCRTKACDELKERCDLMSCLVEIGGLEFTAVAARGLNGINCFTCFVFRERSSCQVDASLQQVSHPSAFVLIYSGTKILLSRCFLFQHFISSIFPHSLSWDLPSSSSVSTGGGFTAATGTEGD